MSVSIQIPGYKFVHVCNLWGSSVCRSLHNNPLLKWREMDDDSLIVIDDVETTEMRAGPSTAANSQSTSSTFKFPSDAFPRPMNVAEHSMASSGRSTRSSSNPPMQRSTEASERTTRSATAKFKPQPKLKLKLSDKAAAQAPGMSFLGQYDRELDSDDEDLAFEEQFILRMPPGEDLEKLKKMVATREVTNDVWFKFKGVSNPPSLGVPPPYSMQTLAGRFFTLGAQHTPLNWSTCLALLSRKRHWTISKCSKSQIYARSGITLCNVVATVTAYSLQMLVVENRIDSDEPVSNQRSFNIDEFIWPHGITPPLHHVRKRRFRKRVNRRVCVPSPLR